MSGDTPDFEDTTFQETTATGAAFLDVSLADLKTLLESMELTVTGKLDTDLSELLDSLVTIESLTVAAPAMQPTTPAPLRFRTGTILHWEDFADGNGYWQIYTSGTGAASALDTTYWHRGGQCWLLTGGSSSAYQARLYCQLGRMEKIKLGVEWAMSHGDDADYMRFYFEPTYASTYARYAVKFDVTNDQISIRDENAVYQVVRDPMALSGAYQTFHHIKLIVDVENLLYDTLFVNEEEIDLSAYSVATAAVSADTPLEVRWVLVGTGGDNPEWRIDSVALTDES